MHLSWLAPDISAAIVKGRHPKHLNARKLLRTNGIPLEWDAQRGGVGFQLIGTNAPNLSHSRPRYGCPKAAVLAVGISESTTRPMLAIAADTPVSRKG